MVSRICPNCSVILGSYDSYFCSSCGAELTESEILKSRTYLREISVDIEEPTHRKIKDILLPVFKNAVHVINLKELILVSIGILILLTQLVKMICFFPFSSSVLNNTINS